MISHVSFKIEFLTTHPDSVRDVRTYSLELMIMRNYFFGGDLFRKNQWSAYFCHKVQRKRRQTQSPRRCHCRNHCRCRVIGIIIFYILLRTSVDLLVCSANSFSSTERTCFVLTVVLTKC